MVSPRSLGPSGMVLPAPSPGPSISRARASLTAPSREEELISALRATRCWPPSLPKKMSPSREAVSSTVGETGAAALVKSLSPQNMRTAPRTMITKRRAAKRTFMDPVRGFPTVALILPIAYLSIRLHMDELRAVKSLAEEESAHAGKPLRGVRHIEAVAGPIRVV